MEYVLLFSIIHEILQRSGKRLVLLPRAFGGPFRVLAGTEEFFVFMPTGQQTVNVPGRVRKAVLVEHSGPPGQADTGKPIVLGDDNISRLHPVDQGKVHAVSALVKDQRLSTLPLDAITGTPWTRPIRTVRSTTGQPSASIKIVGILISFPPPLIGGFLFVL